MKNNIKIHSLTKNYVFFLFFMLFYVKIILTYINIKKNMSILDWVQLLSDLSESEKNELSLFCQEKHLEPWETLFVEEEEASAMYLLIDGSIEISRSIDWVKTIIWEVHAEEILWEMALFWDTNKRMATATATQECTLIVILSFSIKELTTKHPDLLDKIRMIINYRMVSNKNMK